MKLRNDILWRFLIPLILVHETQNSEVKSLSKRLQKRSIFPNVLQYTYNACTGILVAIAVPLSLDSRAAFVSYNFEMNYNMPNQPEEGYPGPIIRFPGLIPEDTRLPDEGRGSPDDMARKLEATNSTEKEENDEVTNEPEGVQTQKHERISLTRKSIYQMIESRLRSIGIDGKKCWLRAICEASKHSVLDANGIIGHVIHIFLTPSSSKDEGFPSEYLKAEESGRSGSCLKYQNKCPFALIENFTKLIG